MFHSESELRPSLDEIAIIVSRIIGVSLHDVYDQNRKREVVDARRILTNIAREFGYTLQEIGGVFGKHHSSVINLIKTYEQLIDGDLTFRKRAKFTKEQFNFFYQFIKNESMSNSTLSFAPEPPLWPEEWTDIFTFDGKVVEGNAELLEECIGTAVEDAHFPPFARHQHHFFTSHQMLVDNMKDQLYGAEIPFRHIHIPDSYGA